MADTAIWSFTDGTTADGTDRIATARSSSANVYITPATIVTYITGLANTWAAGQVFTTNLRAPLVIGGTGTTSTLTFKTTTGVGTTNADMIFQVGNNGATEAMRILNSGTVGIGTASPAAASSGAGLDVTGMVVARGTLAAHQTAAGVFEYNANKVAIRAYGATAGTGVIAFNVGGGGGDVDAEAMRIIASGNVGIGTGSPGALLDVRGTVIFNEAGGDFDVRMEGDTDANLFFLDASTDRIGIGTASPGFKFDVNGAINGTAHTGTTFSGTGAFTALSGTAIPAGGTAGSGYKFSSTSNFGVFFGSGAPSLAAAQGSLYLRSDGSTVATRAYVNTDGNTTWTPITTVG